MQVTGRMCLSTLTFHTQEKKTKIANYSSYHTYRSKSHWVRVLIERSHAILMSLNFGLGLNFHFNLLMPDYLGVDKNATWTQIGNNVLEIVDQLT